ncbi:mechanosensitive ion channel family protein [Natrialbaceae archaeon A-CW3]
MSENATSGNQTVLGEEVRALVPDVVPSILIDVAFALAILAVGWYLSKVAVRLTGRTVAQKIERPSVTRTVLRGVRITIIALTALVAANVLGLGGSEILLSVTVISAVIAIVLAPLIGSLINGLFILADRPFEIGDMIEVADEGHRGFVEDITIRYTKIFTLENTFIVIPNSEIHRRDVINYSAEDERTRVEVSFEITYESDLERAIRVAERGARSVDNVIAGGPDIRIGSARYAASPTCDIVEYGDNGILLKLRFWAKHPYKLTVVQSDVQRRVRQRFEDEDIEFAYPHRHHVFDDTSGTAHVARVDPSTEVAHTTGNHEAEGEIGADDR